MKKRYLFMSSFFVAATVFTLLFFLSFQTAREEKQEVEYAEETNLVDTIQETRVSTDMTFIVEEYDETTGIVNAEERTIPAEYAGMTRKELEHLFTDYNQAIQDQKTVDGPNHIELISFSADKIIVRQTYDSSEDTGGFFLKLQEGEVVVFCADRVTPFEYTGISENRILEDERSKLKEGYFVQDEKELYSVLENLSS